MANFEFATVTDHTFKVKDPEAFEKELIGLGVSNGDWSKCYEGLVLERQEDGTYWLGGYNADFTIWRDGIDQEIDLLPIIAKHIADDDYAVFMSAGSEKLRYVSGFVAVVAKGKVEVQGIEWIAQFLLKKLKVKV